MIALKPLYKSQDNSYGFRKCCETIRNAVPIEEVASHYTKLEPCGGKAWFTGRCPLPQHEDKTPSFYIYRLPDITATAVADAVTWWTSSSTVAITESFGKRWFLLLSSTASSCPARLKRGTRRKGGALPISIGPTR